MAGLLPVAAIEERVIGVDFEITIFRQDANEQALGKAVSEETNTTLAPSASTGEDARPRPSVAPGFSS